MVVRQKKIEIIKPSLDKLKDFQQWKEANDGDFSLWDYLFGVSHIEIAIAFASLFWTEFIEYERGIFLAESFNVDIYQQWKAQLNNNITDVERVLNHHHIDDLLPGSEQVGMDNLYYLGQTIAQMWKSRLQSLYPNQNFELLCHQDESTVTITFYQK